MWGEDTGKLGLLWISSRIFQKRWQRPPKHDYKVMYGKNNSCHPVRVEWYSITILQLEILEFWTVVESFPHALRGSILLLFIREFFLRKQILVIFGDLRNRFFWDVQLKVFISCRKDQFNVLIFKFWIEDFPDPGWSRDHLLQYWHTVKFR